MLFRLNKLKESTKKEGIKLISYALLMIFMIIFIGAFGVMMALSYANMGMTSIIIPTMMMQASLGIIIMTFFRVGGLLFGEGDYDLLMAMPFKTVAVVASRLISMYIFNLAVAIVLLVPGTVVYCITVHPSVGFYLMFFICLWFVPLIPLLISAIIGTLLAFVSSRFRHKNVALLIGGFAALFAYLYVVLDVQDQGESQLINMGQAMLAQLQKVYPPAILYAQGLVDGQILSFLGYILLSGGLTGAFVWGLSIKYKELCGALHTQSTKRNYKVTDLKTASPFMALYKRELKRYFATPFYVLNTLTGVLFLLLGAGYILFMDSAQLKMLLVQFKGMFPVEALVILAIHVTVALTATSASSISLEGKNLWIPQSLPIRSRDFLNSKMAVNLTLTIPAIFIAGVIANIRLGGSPGYRLLYFVTPLACTFCYTILGLWLNMKHPNFKWTNEAVVYKNSFPVMIISLGGMLPPVGLMALVCFVPGIDFLVMWCLTGLMILLAGLLYRQMGHFEIRQLNQDD